MLYADPWLPHASAQNLLSEPVEKLFEFIAEKCAPHAGLPRLA